MTQPMEMLYDWALLYGTRVVGAILIIVIGRMVVGILTKVIRRLLRKGQTDDTLAKFVVSLAKIALMTFVFIAALGTLGVQTASFVAVIGAAGLAIGFALQGSLANFASGVMLIIFRPFKGGDFVEAGGAMGSVEAIHIFNTIMKTPDNKKIIVPNSKITSDSITNYSAMETRRIDLVFGIGYGDDIKKAKELLLRILAADDRVLEDPEATVAVGELADSSVNFVVRPWVKSGDYWAVRFDLIEKIKLAFDEQGITIPFPQRDVHLLQASVT